LSRLVSKRHMADIALIIQGNLFSRDFLTEGIRGTPEWLVHDDASIDQLHADLSIIFSKLPLNKATSESQTEDDLILARSEPDWMGRFASPAESRCERTGRCSGRPALREFRSKGAS
jgi:hypothetical protein